MEEIKTDKLERRKKLLEDLVDGQNWFKDTQIEKFHADSIFLVGKAQEFTKFIISIQIGVLAVVIPLLSQSKFNEIYLIACALIFFIDVVFGIFLLRSIIVSDLKSSPDMLDEALNHSNKIIKEIIT